MTQMKCGARTLTLPRNAKIAMPARKKITGTTDSLSCELKKPINWSGNIIRRKAKSVEKINNNEREYKNPKTPNTNTERYIFTSSGRVHSDPFIAVYFRPANTSAIPHCMLKIEFLITYIYVAGLLKSSARTPGDTAMAKAAVTARQITRPGQMRSSLFVRKLK